MPHAPGASPTVAVLLRCSRTVPPPLHRAWLAVVATALAFPGRAAAQGAVGGRAVDAYSGVAVGSGRVVALGGAYVGIAEGLGGAPVNPASVAHRRRDLGRGWDLDGTLSFFVLDARQDLDNDGARDAGVSGHSHLELGGGFQRGRLGFGLLARSWLATGPRTAAGSAGIQTGDVSLGTGYSSWHDALVLGGSLTITSGAVIQYRPDGKEERRLPYNAATVRLGGLWRPRGQPFRLGGFWDPGARARAGGDAGGFPGATPRSFEFPWTAAVGVSAWAGPNARRYNEPSQRELSQDPELGPGPAWGPGTRPPVLLAAQLDVVGPAHDAVTVTSALGQGSQVQRSGRTASVVPRAGAEWEAVRRWLRIRGGYYLEPSRTGAGPRSHGTFGADVRIPMWPWDLRLGLAGDLAERYRNVGLSLGFWSELGPVPPAEGGAAGSSPEPSSQP